MMYEITELYSDVYNPKVKMITRILHGDYSAAEDIVQEAFTRALKFYPSFDPEVGSLHAWFNGILFNSLRDYQKEKRGEIISICKDVNPEEVISGLEVDRTLLHKMINDTKNLKHKRVLELFFILGYTSTEISQIEDGISQSNVTTIVNRFRESIK